MIEDSLLVNGMTHFESQVAKDKYFREYMSVGLLQDGYSGYRRFAQSARHKSRVSGVSCDDDRRKNGSNSHS